MNLEDNADQTLEERVAALEAQNQELLNQAKLAVLRIDATMEALVRAINKAEVAAKKAEPK